MYKKVPGIIFVNFLERLWHWLSTLRPLTATNSVSTTVPLGSAIITCHNLARSRYFSSIYEKSFVGCGPSLSPVITSQDDVVSRQSTRTPGGLHRYVNKVIPQEIAHHAQSASRRTPGPRLNIKTIFPRYGDSHVKDKTVGETIVSLTWEFLYW